METERDTVLLNPLCTDISQDAPHPVVLGCGLARLADGAVMAVYSTPSSYYSPPGSTCLACRVTHDGGKTWSPAETTPISSTHAPGHLARRADGRIALVWHRPEKRRGELRLAFSSDEGRTWAHALVLATGKQVPYPYAIEIEPGSLRIGCHNVPKGWMLPQARHLRVPRGGG